ncbi:MAG: beta-ketoacyl-ACP synthase [Xanthomonadales bacterium]|nr:beta-ketoacyl-ACP synthase [Gammaproteobacteria bacterium]MBT8053125.1 beta-ketoacyl-ACP synthase [Gammaproteobacteria bacterium]NND56223.1 beta-ketoacyl-ACP synthase [Xanthomonadales bacterium]NNK52298.1 beta-ketoacyl-ACP synthase [Xanthomonadales bacterium]
MSHATRDHLGRPVVVVTGIGIVTSLGEGKQDNWRNLVAGISGVRQIDRFSTEGLRTQIAGLIDWQGDGPYCSPVHSLTLARKSASEAIAQSKIGSQGSFPGPLFLAISPAETKWDQRMDVYKSDNSDNSTGYERLIRNASQGDFHHYYSLFQYGSTAEFLAGEFGTRGQPISLTTACASGATSVQLGVEAIRRGDTDAALCVGTDGEICEEMVVRFTLLSALSTQNDDPQGASKPFSKTRDGFVMAEGSATLVLESYDSAKARGAKILGVVRGTGERADTFHRTRSKPDGSAIIDTITRSLADAGMSPADIDCINAHGTSTPENDKMEYLALSAALGSELDNTPISSNKSMIGHTLSAAGTIEAAISLMTISNGVIPPTINCHEQDPNILMDVVPNVKREQPVSTVMSNSFGFGGQNVCLIFSAEPD